MQLAREQWTQRAAEGTLTPSLVRAVKSDGYAILESVFPEEKLATWRDTFGELLEAKLAEDDNSRGNNRVNVKVPIAGPFNDPELLHNDLVMPVVYELFGPDPICSWYTADTPLPGAEYQPAHKDDRGLFPSADVALPIYALVINVPLVDCREDNGPMEWWPGGTHMLTGVSPIEGSADRKPMRGILPKGSVFIRDTRMWHRGTPNNSGEIRPLMSLVMSRFWYMFGELIADGPRLNIDAETYDGFADELKSLFRYADVPGDRTMQVRIDAQKRTSPLREPTGAGGPIGVASNRRLSGHSRNYMGVI